MQYRVAIGLLAVTIALAGCVAAVGGADTGVDRPDADGAQAAETQVPGQEAVDAIQKPTVVAVEADGEPGVATRYVRRAAGHWENASEDVRFALASSAPEPEDYPLGIGVDRVEPDLVVRFADGRVTCESGSSDPAPFCTDAASDDGPPTATISPGLTEDAFESATTTAIGRLAGHDGTASAVDLPDPAFADPWPAKRTVTVNVVNEANPDRDFEPLVTETLRWWEDNDEQWGNYTTDWRLVDDPDADVTVAFVDRVQRCGGHTDPGSLLGCAPVLHPGNLADDGERVRIKGGYTDETTLRILKHEFGHVYGLSHGAEPEEIMSARLSTTRRSEPDASERGFAWGTDEGTIPPAFRPEDGDHRRTWDERLG